MKVLSYNCCALPLLSGDIPARLERVAREVRSLDPDLILFQELFLERHLATLKSGLPRWRHVFSWAKAWRTFGGGLAVFSKHPLVDAKFHRFRDQGPWLRYSLLGRVSRKGFVSAVAHPDGVPAFRLIAVHPAADYQSWRGGAAGADGPAPFCPHEAGHSGASAPLGKANGGLAAHLWRKGAIARGDPYPGLQRAQLEQLKTFILGTGRDLPLIVGGDFNLTPVSEIFRDFTALTGLRDCMRGSTRPSVVSKPYYRIPYHFVAGRRLDYILLRGGRGGEFRPVAVRYALDAPVELEKGRPLTLSDHYGVLADLVWSESRERV